MTTLQRRPTVPEEPGAHPADHAHGSQIRAFQGVLATGDFVVIALSVAAGHLLKFGFNDPTIQDSSGTISLSYLPVSVGLGLVWWLMLAAFHTYRQRLLGSGTEEYQRVFQATFLVFGALAIASYLLKAQLARGYFLAVLPIGLVGLFLWRWLARKRLVRLRRRGELTNRVVILGGSRTAADMARELRRRRDLGMEVVGACVADQPVGSTLRGTSVPVFGDLGVLPTTMRELDADTLVVTGSPDISAAEIKELSWRLDPVGTNVVLAPSIVDVAGPRVHLRPVDGLSLVEIEMPRFDGSKQVLKRGFDIIVSALLIIALLPVWIIVPILIWFDDKGPIFFHQTRVGLNGEEFSIWKFRSMRVNADAELAALLKAQGTSDKPLFKVDHDPRITKLGAFLRKSSIDELPQLFNVFNGTMSLVGPRPQVPAEVALYDNAAARRLFVKPGVTGLWQVSGRSNLKWEEAVRFDLFYVENWSITGDIQILFRTIKVVFAREGAG